MHRLFLDLVIFLNTAALVPTSVWQWSVPMGNGRAFLWIPEDCKQVRAVVVAQHNMIEQGILEHPDFRRTLGDLGIAEVWIAPPFDNVFHFDQGAGDKFNAMMKGLADASGYRELEFAPIIPLGHSACASYPWNFSAWNPARTLAVLSVHGDAPQTNLTGSGHPNPDWGDRSIAGIPGLMVMGEYEWLEGRLQPLIDFRARHPQVPLAMLAEPGSGHFNFDDQLVHFLGMFIRDAAEDRLPSTEALDETPSLKPIDPRQGWLVERWHPSEDRTIPSAPYDKYTGDRSQTFWCFDEKMAHTLESYSASQVGKRPQLVSITAGKMPLQSGCGEPVNLPFNPDADGVTFHVKTAFMDAVPADPKNRNPARWASLPPGSPLGHAMGGGPIIVHKIVGPVIKLADNAFSLRLDRNAETTDKRLLDTWLWASHPADDKYKSIVQQAFMRATPNAGGTDQHITFPAIPDQKTGAIEETGGKAIELKATSDSGMPVYYYVREGPAEIVEGKSTILRLNPVPPRSKFPVAVTVVAWQWGRTGDPPVNTASPVTQIFRIVK